MDPDAIPSREEQVIAIVGTAGTTDLGAIDPLDALADKAQERGAWFHVDAAVGSGLMLSDRHKHRLKGIERADSVTADLHKLWWMPFGASALLVPDVGSPRPSITRACTSIVPRTRPRASSTSSAARSTRRGASTR